MNCAEYKHAPVSYLILENNIISKTRKYLVSFVSHEGNFVDVCTNRNYMQIGKMFFLCTQFVFLYNTWNTEDKTNMYSQENDKDKIIQIIQRRKTSIGYCIQYKEICL